MAPGPCDPVVCRLITPADLDACMALKCLAGWNQLREDWEIFLRLNPGGCFAAWAGDRLVGTATCIDYGGRFSWVGMVLVHPDLRRRGIGTTLMNAVLTALSGCETVKLDATPAGRELYLRLGFADEYDLARLVAPRADWGGAEPGDAGIEPLQPRGLEAVADLDAGVFGADRRELLRAWYERTPQAAFILRRDGRVAGYAMGRPGANFATIGPVIAESEQDACRLTRAAGLSFCPGPVGVDSPGRHAGFRSWLESRGFSFQRPLLRMYRGPNRFPGQPGRQWAILGPEVG